MNEKEIEKEIENATNTQFDARVVHTVRNLKKLPSRHSDENSAGSSMNSRKRDSKNNGQLDNGTGKSLAKSVNERVSSNKKEKNILNNLNERISIDGSGQSTSDSIKADAETERLRSNKIKKEQNLQNSQQILRKSQTKNVKPVPISNKNINTFKYSYSSNQNFHPGTSSAANFTSNKFAPLKTKSEFQKRLMSENNIIKYKATCVGLIKDDDELKKMCEICFGITTGGLTNSNSMFGNPNQIYENFIDENLFNDNFFLYKLESLLNSDVSKQNKEKFFKLEIKKAFEIKVVDIQYENKLKGLNFAIDSHISRIQNYEFFS